MQAVVTLAYYVAVLYFGAILVWNLLGARDTQKAALYLLVLMPFVMRILRLK